MAGIKNLAKMPKRKVTVSDILGRDDLDSAIKDLLDAKETFTELLIIGKTNEGEIWWRHSAMPISRLIYVMEVVKNSLLNRGEE